MDRDYAIFMQSINEIKDKLEKENNDSYKKILKDPNVDEFWSFDKNEVKKYKEYKEKALSLLEKQMQNAGVKTFETERLKATRVLPSETTTFDAKALLADMPELAEKYKKTSVRKGYLKLTIKK